jgi:hypothetical protein
LRRLRRRSVPLLWFLLVAGVLLLVGGVLLAAKLPGLRRDLLASKAALVATQDALSRDDVARARAQLSEAARRSQHVDDVTHGWLWKAYAHVPVVGTDVRELQAVSAAVDSTTRTVLPPLLDVGLRPASWNGRLDVRPFERAQVPLDNAEARLRETRAALRLAPSGGVEAITKARVQLDDALTRLARQLRDARVAAHVVPEMLGGDARYFVAVQNNAEARATGGLIGAYGILRAHDGRLTLERVGSDAELVDPASPAIDLGSEYDQRYARFQTTRTWRSANLSPDTPTVGKLLVALWAKQTRQRLDGALFIDPVGLADLLAATGPVALPDGTTLTQKNAVRVLLVDAYRRFPREQDAARNAYLHQAARVVLTRLTAGPVPGSVARAVANAVASGHLQAYSSHSSTQNQLASAPVGGALESSGPFLEVVTQDVGGSKLDVYQRRSVRYEAEPTGQAVDLGHGAVLEEQAKVTVTLRNDAPAGLPAYVTLRPDDPGAPVGQSKTWVSVYLGKGATLLGATLNGVPVSLETATDNGLGVFSAFVTTDRGATSVLVLTVRQPASPGQPLLFRQQPLVLPDQLVVRRGGAPVDKVYEP